MEYIILHISEILVIFNIVVGCLPVPEADLGLLEHPRWSIL